MSSGPYRNRVAITSEENARRHAQSYQKNKEQRNAKAKKRYHDNREAIRTQQRLQQRTKRGIKNATGEERVGTCPICLRENMRLVCDHNHETGEIRGWPCRNCNRVLGIFGDSLERVLRAAKYLGWKE